MNKSQLKIFLKVRKYTSWATKPTTTYQKKRGKGRKRMISKFDKKDRWTDTGLGDNSHEYTYKQNNIKIYYVYMGQTLN